MTTNKRTHTTHKKATDESIKEDEQEIVSSRNMKLINEDETKGTHTHRKNEHQYTQLVLAGNARCNLSLHAKKTTTTQY